MFILPHTALARQGGKDLEVVHVRFDQAELGTISLRFVSYSIKRESIQAR